jgi:hypothetical protein
MTQFIIAPRTALMLLLVAAVLGRHRSLWVKFEPGRYPANTENRSRQFSDKRELVP